MRIFTIMLSLACATCVQSFQVSQEVESENNESEKGLFESLCEYITENTVTNPDFGKDISDR